LASEGGGRKRRKRLLSSPERPRSDYLIIDFSYSKDIKRIDGGVRGLEPA